MAIATRLIFYFKLYYCLKAAEGDTGSWPMFKNNPERTGSN